MFKPMKPETVARRAVARDLARRKALPEMIARREAMALRSTHPDDRAHWQAAADRLRLELSHAS